MWKWAEIVWVRGHVTFRELPHPQTDGEFCLYTPERIKGLDRAVTAPDLLFSISEPLAPVDRVVDRRGWRNQWEILHSCKTLYKLSAHSHFLFPEGILPHHVKIKPQLFSHFMMSLDRYNSTVITEYRNIATKCLLQSFRRANVINLKCLNGVLCHYWLGMPQYSI